MNPNKLYKEIGLIDDDLIMEAETMQKLKPFYGMWKQAGLVACLTLIVLGSILLPRLTKEHGILPETDSNIKKPGDFIVMPHIDKNGIIFNKAIRFEENKIYIQGHFWEELTEEEIKAVLPGLPDTVETTATANFQGDGTLFNIYAHTKVKSGADVYIQLAPGEPILDYSFDITPEESQINDVPVLAGYFEGSHTNVYFANFRLNDVGYYVELRIDAGDKVLLENTKEMFTELIFHIISGGAAGFSVLNPVIPELRDDKLSIQDAYADKDFGVYLPQDLPNGFSFESSVRFINQERNYLIALWSKGLNDITWMVSNLSESDAVRITSVADRKDYNLELYPIPRTDSVPKELSEMVDNPIFRINDLTLEAVKARAYTVNDRGDEGGYRMHFSVLYSEDILVEINAKGADPEYIFNQLIDINQQ